MGRGGVIDGSAFQVEDGGKDGPNLERRLRTRCRWVMPDGTRAKPEILIRRAPQLWRTKLTRVLTQADMILRYFIRYGIAQISS